MDETQPGQRLERDADELEHRIGRLEEHIEDAQQSAAQRRKEAEEPGDAAAGDWHDTAPDEPNGDDPVGAVN